MQRLKSPREGPAFLCVHDSGANVFPRTQDYATVGDFRCARDLAFQVWPYFAGSTVPHERARHDRNGFV